MEKDIYKTLNDVFGYDDFRSHQLEIIQSVLDGRDTLAVLPTGCGKSLCFQIPALHFKGVSLVLSPLVSLMKDQVDSLVKKGVSATYINSSLSFMDIRKRLTDVCNGYYKIVYISPERIQTKAFQFVFSHLVKHKVLSLIAVDEAHCISQWGNDFRPNYRHLAGLREHVDVPVLAVTATATEVVKKDIIDRLNFGEDYNFFEDLLNRPNLKLGVVHCLDKQESLLDFLDKYKDSSGIVFCTTRKSVNDVYMQLKALDKNVCRYHGGLSINEKKSAQELFIESDNHIMVSTNAFGMGVDKPDIRFIVHYQMPGSIENYVQEIGRAGRDGEDSECLLLYSVGDRSIQEFFINSSETQRHVIDYMIEVLEPLSYPFVKSDEQFRSLFPKSREVLKDKSLLKYLNTLEEIGFLTWSPSSGKKMYFKNEGYDPISLALGYLRYKKELQVKKLNAMDSYCMSGSCLRNELQRYFDHDDVDCNFCSNCLNEQNTDLDLHSKLSFEILSCLRTYQNLYGIHTICDLLAGKTSKSIKVKELQGSKYFGNLSSHHKNTLVERVKMMILKGVITRTSDEYPKIGLSSDGESIIDR
ncbi:MAG: ATP-dependent DNA helicase RecQ [Candidatus Cloacimonetes bacterium]|nr:ATP-dependent DNA helicase RecQ [Candidatus Cloacimonadota bacterium]